MRDTGTSTLRILVLVVEDEPVVRAMAVDFLEEEDFDVIEASTADHAAALLRARNDIRVIFTDVAMPGELNGFDLARMAQALYPHVAVLVVSGGLPPGFSGVAPQARFLRKPYRMIDVIRIIREMVDGARPASS
jgi:CheY-like chemotaxis protein